MDYRELQDSKNLDNQQLADKSAYLVPRYPSTIMGISFQKHDVRDGR